MVVFASLTALVYTASIGFRYVGYGRDRIQATGVANRVMEDIRGLAYTKITNGISSTELTSDSRIEELLRRVSVRNVLRREDRLVHVRPELRGRVARPAHRPTVRRQPRLHVPRVRHERHADHHPVPRDGDHRVVERSDQERAEQLGPAPEPLLVAERMRQPQHASVRRPLPALLLRPGRRAAGATGRHRSAPRLRGRLRFARAHPPGHLSDGPGGADDRSSTRPPRCREFVDSTGTSNVGNQQATSEADDEVETSASSASGGNSTGLTPHAASRLNSDCCNQIGVSVSVPSGDQEHRATSVDAKVADTYACPTTGVRETDLLPCAGGHIRQVGTTTVAVPVTHVTATVGSANLLRSWVRRPTPPRRSIEMRRRARPRMG